MDSSSPQNVHTLWPHPFHSSWEPIRIYFHQATLIRRIDVQTAYQRRWSQKIVVWYLCLILGLACGLISMWGSLNSTFDAVQWGTLLIVTPCAVQLSFLYRPVFHLLVTNSLEFWWLGFNLVGLVVSACMLIPRRSIVWLLLGILGLHILISDCFVLQPPKEHRFTLFLFESTLSLILVGFYYETWNYWLEDRSYTVAHWTFRLSHFFINRLLTCWIFFFKDLIHLFLYPSSLIRLQSTLQPYSGAPHLSLSPPLDSSFSSSSLNQIVPVLKRHHAPILPGSNPLFVVESDIEIAPVHESIELDDRVLGTSVWMPRCFRLNLDRVVSVHQAYFRHKGPALLFVSGVTLGLVGLLGVSHVILSSLCVPCMLIPMFVRVYFFHPKMLSRLLCSFDVWWICLNLVGLFLITLTLYPNHLICIWLCITLSSLVTMLADAVKLTKSILLPSMFFCFLSVVLMILFIYMDQGPISQVSDLSLFLGFQLPSWISLHDLFLDRLITLAVFDLNCCLKLYFRPQCCLFLTSRLSFRMVHTIVPTSPLAPS